MCNVNTQLLTQIADPNVIYSIQNHFSLLQRQDEFYVLPYCKLHNINYLAYSPLQSSLLSGNFALSKLPTGDWRHQNDFFKSPRLERYLGMVENLREIAQRHETTVGSLAINWVLNRPNITSAIVGMRLPQQVQTNAQAPDLNLSSAELLTIASICQE